MCGMVSSTLKTDFEKFDEKRNFILWQQRMKDLLVQNIIYKVLIRDRPEKITIENGEEVEEITFSTIRMYLVDKVLPEISIETIPKGL